MFQITTQTAPCIRHLYVRHVQSTKNVIEQQGDMTTQPVQTELTPAGLEMAKCMVNGLMDYMARPSCDPNGAKQCPVVYISCFTEPLLHRATMESHATFDFLAAELAVVTGHPRFGCGIVYSIEICTAKDICDILSGVGLTGVPLGVPLGSVTIVDEFPYNKFFVHAVGDLGLLKGYPLDKINYWNNTP